MTIDNPDGTRIKSKRLEIKSINRRRNILNVLVLISINSESNAKDIQMKNGLDPRQGWNPKSRQWNRRIKLLITYRAKLRSVDRNFIYLLVRKTNMMAFNLWACPPGSRCYSLQYTSIRTSWYLFQIRDMNFYLNFLFVSWRQCTS